MIDTIHFIHKKTKLFQKAQRLQMKYFGEMNLKKL